MSAPLDIMGEDIHEEMKLVLAVSIVVRIVRHVYFVKTGFFPNTLNGAHVKAIFYYSLIVSAREDGLNPFEYLLWIFTNAPNRVKPGYVTKKDDFLPGSATIPRQVFSPIPMSKKPEKYAREKDS